MPSGTADFYTGSTKIASVAKGAEVIVDNISVGPFIVTVKIGTDTIYIDEFLFRYSKTMSGTTLLYNKFLPFSDKRLKKNIVSVNNVLANFDKLNVYSYEYKAPAGYTGFIANGKHFGFIAQELKVVSEFIATEF